MKTKTNFTLLAMLACALALTFTSCSKDKDDDPGNYIKLDGQSFAIPASGMYYFDYGEMYIFGIAYGTENGTMIGAEINIDKRLLGSSFPLGVRGESWGLSVLTEFPDESEFDMAGDNEDMKDFASGTMLIKSLGESKFEMNIKASGPNGTIELKYKGAFQMFDPS